MSGNGFKPEDDVYTPRAHRPHEDPASREEPAAMMAIVDPRTPSVVAHK